MQLDNHFFGLLCRRESRPYLSTGFYKDHLRTCKKRHIHWLFSSRKERAHPMPPVPPPLQRVHPLPHAERLRHAPFRQTQRPHGFPPTGKGPGRFHFRTKQGPKADRRLEKKLEELSSFDDELRHQADKRITLELDDGVKANCGTSGKLLAEVKEATGAGEE